MNTIPLFSFSFRHGVNSFFSVQRKDHGARGKFTLYTGGLGWFGAFFLIFHELENEGCFFDSHDTTTSWRMGWDDFTHASAQGSEEQKGGDGSRVGQGGSQSVGWAATGRYGRYTRDIYLGGKELGGGWLQDPVFTFIYTQLHMLSWWGFFCGFV